MKAKVLRMGMKLKFLFDNNSRYPNINEGNIFKNIFLETKEDGEIENNHVLELDTTRVMELMDVDKEEAVRIQTAVVNSIWRMKESIIVKKG